MMAAVKVGGVVLVALPLLCLVDAFAVESPNNDYSGTSLYPSPRSCFGSSCYTPVYGAAQSLDCNQAGTAIPEPAGVVLPPENWADGLAISLDYWEIEVEDALGVIGSGGDARPILGERDRGIRNRFVDSLSSYYTDDTEDDLSEFGYQPDGTHVSYYRSVFDGSHTVSRPSENWSVIGKKWPQTDVRGAQPASYQYRAFPPYGATGASDWPSANRAPNLSHLFGPVSGPLSFAGPTNLGGDLPDQAWVLPARSYSSVNVQVPASGFPSRVYPYVTQNFDLGGRNFATLTYESRQDGLIRNDLRIAGVIVIETNWCRIVLVPSDPNYKRTGRHSGNSWGARLDDQWAIKRVGFTDDEDSAWNHVPDSAPDVVVAVIDTGLDWHHLDISPQNIWRNPREIPDNNVDDDNNGYVDDIIGWNFLGRNNKPWDFDGHGTVVAGIIGAAQNDSGIAGINPHAKIMVLKGVNNFGTTRASYLAEAIKYAADNGAKIINISVGGPHETEIEKAAIAYAHDKGVLIIAASGNEGVELKDFGPGGNDHVLTVGATHTDDRVGGFSNFGDGVDLVAPGVDVLSLRARFTDVNYRPASGEEYEIGSRYVGEDKRYIHVSGTSFSTPIVTGVASLILAKHPQLSAADVERLLIETAEDIEFPGKDKYAGYGMVDARAALSVEPDFSVTAEISGLEFVQTEDKDQIHVLGSIGAGAFKRAWVQIGAGENPAVWKAVGQKRKLPIDNGVLSTIDLSEFAGSELWQVVVNVEHRNGVVKRVVRPLRIK